MSDALRQQAKTSFEQVQAILHGQWDPIGCSVPRDEYDSYAWPVLKLLQERAPREEIERYLRWAANVNMTCPVPEERLIQVVDRLMALGVG